MVQILHETARSGNLALLESLLRHLPKNEINRVSQLENTPLHCVVWNGQHELLQKLLEYANTDIQDGESGWSALHRALYWGDFWAASILLQHGASMCTIDHQGRAAVDLVSYELKEHLQAGGMLNVFSWGSGANYQLGTGKTDLISAPMKIDALHGLKVVAIEAAKFHSCALTQEGHVYTWGWGRGGRLGHPEFRNHSDEGAQIEPRIVKKLQKMVVTQVTSGKHHTAVITNTGEVYTWGSNKDGRLGYPSVDTQPTPKKVSLKQSATCISAGNRHTVIVSEEGQIFTWGSNRFGQLGYGTSDSGCSPNPRMVESMQGRRVTQVSAAKRHTVALTADGEVFTWGHCVVAPKRVVMQGRVDTWRSDKKTHIRFHKFHEEVTRPRIALIAAGSAHTTCVTEQGFVLAWRSWDPKLDVIAVGGQLMNRHTLQVSAGKERTTLVTDEGDIYFWEGSSQMPQHSTNIPPKWAIQVQRQFGVKKVVNVAVGEKHTLALQSIWMPPLPVLRTAVPKEEKKIFDPSDLYTQAADELAQDDDSAALLGSSFKSTEAMFDTIGKSWEGSSFLAPSPRQRPKSNTGPASLQMMCQVEVAKMLVDLKLCVQMLNYTESMRVDALQEYCMSVVLHNMDVIIQEHQTDFQDLTQHILDLLSEHYNAHFKFVESKTQQQQLQQSSSATQNADDDVDLSRFILEDFDELYQRQPLDEEYEMNRIRLFSLVERIGEFTTSGMRSSRVVPTPSIPPKPESPSKLVRQNSGASSNLSLLTQSMQALKSGDADDASIFLDEAQAVEQEAVFKLSRTLNKKLQQIYSLESRLESGERMDLQQLTKIGQKSAIEAAQNALEHGMSSTHVQEMLKKMQETASVGKGEKDAISKLFGSSPNLTSLQSSSQKTKKGRKNKNKSGKSLSGTEQEQQLQQNQFSKQQSQLTNEIKEEIFRGESPSASSFLSRQEKNLSSGAPSGPLGNDLDFPALGKILVSKKVTPEKQPLVAKPKSKSSKQVKKGALSLFLSGELEEKACAVSQPEPVAPKPVAKVPSRPPQLQQPQIRSLRDIQEEEKRGKFQRSKKVTDVQGPSNVSNEGPSLADFVRSSRTQIPDRRSSQTFSAASSASSLEKVQAATPVPPPPRLGFQHQVQSLRDIQEEQQQDRELMSSVILYKSKSPQQQSVFGSSPVLGSSPKNVGVSSSNASSKWYVAEKSRVHSLAAIQVEEEAMQQLSKIYGTANVRVVDEKGKKHDGFRPPQRIKGFDVQGNSELTSKRSKGRR